MSLLLPDLYVFDCEVFAYDWMFVFKEKATGERYRFHNDNESVAAFMERKPLLVGFNNKHYDNHIIKGVLSGMSPSEIKEINDLIICDGVSGWVIPQLKGFSCFFDSFDLMDDCQQGTSLKSIEAHLGIPIEETEVDFNIDRPLTAQEIADTFKYCEYDVDATEKLFELREDYLRTKITLGKARGLPDRRALYMTNAKLTSIYLKAVYSRHEDEREYTYPDKLLGEYIPTEVFEFFDQIHDASIPSEELWTRKLEIMIGTCPCTLGWGGIHGAIPTYQEEATETRTIRNKDVASYYPHLMTLPLSNDQQYGFCSRNIPSPQIFIDTLEERVRCKRAGDTAKANALKLVLNTTYGAMLNGKGTTAYNDLYDPLMGRSVCVTGQLFLLELSMHLIAECPTLKIIQLNTDGIMVSLDSSDVERYEAVTQEWQNRTGFELEEDFIRKIVQKDVNNYIEIPLDGGQPKIKGGLLVRGIPKAGAFKINNNANIVAKAIVDYFVAGTPVADTVNAAQSIFDFQLISKASGLYSRTFQIIDGKEVSVQRVNRVYAGSDWRYGTLYKQHGASGVVSKIPGLPSCCLVDNDNHLDISDIDRSWYIRLAQKYVDAFQGVKPARRNTRKINSLQKSALALLDAMCQ